MKTTRLLLFIILISWNYCPCHAQVNIPFEEVVDAHRVYKDLSYFNVKKIVKNSGKQSDLFAEGMETDSVIQERRAMINTLSNNLDKFSPEESAEAVALIRSYINQAKALEQKTSKLSTDQVNNISATFAASNAAVSSTYKVRNEQNNELVALVAGRHLDLDIQFSEPLKSNDYIAYIFPKSHKYKAYRECFAASTLPKDITVCKDNLERFAHKWFPGKDPTISNLGTGPYIIIIVNKGTRQVIYHDEVFVPSKDNKLNLTLNSERND